MRVLELQHQRPPILVGGAKRERRRGVKERLPYLELPALDELRHQARKHLQPGATRLLNADRPQTVGERLRKAIALLSRPHHPSLRAARASDVPGGVV